MEPIPDEVVRFMSANVDSIEQLEILRVLGENPQQEWDSQVIGKEIQTTAELANGHLRDLHQRGIITQIALGSELRFRHGAASPKLDKTISRVLQLYKERPVSMIKLVYAQARDPLRALADSFRLRKES